MTVRGISCILLSVLLGVLALGTGIRELLVAAAFLGIFWIFAFVSLGLASLTLTVEAQLDRREVDRGDEVRYSFVLSGRVFLPVAGHLIMLPPGVRPGYARPQSRAFFLRPSLVGWKRTFPLPLTCRHRGRWGVAPQSLRLQDIFGLFSLPIVRHKRVQPQPLQMTVYPRIYPLTAAGDRLSANQGFAVAMLRHAQSGDLFGDTRQYQQGDPFKRVHWKQSARTGQLYVRQFEEQENPRALLVMDLGCRREDIERNADTATELVASLTAHVVAGGREMQVLPVRTRAAGDYLGGNVGCYVHSDRDMPTLMELLCDVQYHRTDEPLDAWQLRDVRLSRVGAVFVVTDNPSASLLEDLRLLRRRGCKVVCFVTALLGGLPQPVEEALQDPAQRPVLVSDPTQISEKVGGAL
ncbi:MAG: DUF58 domain-containing protein [Ruminococcaceae bacterium]|nr:DUF58 domain-containing protein [Oscillospiraceae bacterium]